MNTQQELQENVNCPKDFIQFLNECIECIETKAKLVLKRTGINKARAILSSRKGIELISIPQHLYEQKFKLEVKKLDTFEQKLVSVPTYLNPNCKEISNETRSLKNASIVEQILNSPRVKLSLNDTILLDGRDTELAFADFFFCIKKKER